VAHGGNLFWTCRGLNILSPIALTPAQVIMNINECIKWLDDLKKDAPKLQHDHLWECLALAYAREDTASVISIQKILCAESMCYRWQTVGRAENLNRGCAVTQLKMSHAAGDTLYATREGLETQGAVAIKTR
jgi:hypothetical protein